MDDPVNSLDVKASSGDICTEKNSLLLIVRTRISSFGAYISVLEFIESVQSLLLLLLAMNVHNWDIDIVEKVTVELF